jgi:HNH endonuclease
VNTGGYPNACIKGRTRALPRIVLEQKLGRPIKLGLCALHHCDVRRCLEPEHLYEGTYQDNVDDMHRRGRARKVKGTKHHKAVLTPRLVRQIRQSQYDGPSAALQFGVSVATIYDIRKFRTWTHV